MNEEFGAGGCVAYLTQLLKVKFFLVVLNRDSGSLCRTGRDFEVTLKNSKSEVIVLSLKR
jgi:hypothetical protein